MTGKRHLTICIMGTRGIPANYGGFETFAEELSTRLVQRLLDKHILETTSENAIREAFSKQLKKLSDMEEHDINFKIAPIRQLVPNANFISLYMTQYIIEDLIDHRDIEDIFGEEGDIYMAVDSVLGALRPR